MTPPRLEPVARMPSAVARRFLKKWLTLLTAGRKMIPEATPQATPWARKISAYDSLKLRPKSPAAYRTVPPQRRYLM